MADAPGRAELLPACPAEARSEQTPGAIGDDGSFRQLAAAYPKDDRNRTAVVDRATLLPPDTIPTAELADGILMAMVLLVLLIACANVANLLLALAVGRRQEAAIKLALGATRRRVIGEFLRESSVLCIASAAAGYSIATWTIARYSNFTIEFPGLGTYSIGLNLRLDLTVVAFTIALMLIASVAAGLAPALYASSPDIAQILSGETVAGGTGKAARRNALVVVQIAVCTSVLIGLGLCQRNLYNLRHADMGFSARNLVAITTFPANEGYSEARGKASYAGMREAVAAIPGVESVTLSLGLPLSGGNAVPVQPPDGGQKVSVGHTVADADYFSTLRLPILEGRVFNSSDKEKGTQTVVINRKMEETFWPGRDPLGKTVTAEDPPRRFTVAGVVADGKYDDLDEPRRPFVYYPLSQQAVRHN